MYELKHDGFRAIAHVTPTQCQLVSRRGNVYKIAKQAVMKAGQYAYRDRRNKKREFRALWITRINAGARQAGVSYSQFMAGLKKAGIDMDRKVLADLAVFDKAAFGRIVEQAKTSLAA